MASVVSLELIGDWNKEIGVPLEQALAVSMDVCGRTGEEACRHALILMAQSARAIARKAPKNRRVGRDRGGEYIEVWTQGQSAPRKMYRWMFKDGNKFGLKASWQTAKQISNSGLAKRSWMWGLSTLGAQEGSRAIPGTYSVRSISSANLNGYMKENRLSYIVKAMPPGWASLVELRAGNKIMAQARGKLERQWAAAVRSRQRAAGRAVASFFKKGLAA